MTSDAIVALSTPLAVVVSIIFQQWALAKAAAKVEAVRVAAALTAETVSKSSYKTLEKLGEVHEMVNSNLAKVQAEAKALRDQVTELTARLAILAPKDFETAVRAMLAAGSLKEA